MKLSFLWGHIHLTPIFNKTLCMEEIPILYINNLRTANTANPNYNQLLIINNNYKKTYNSIIWANPHNNRIKIIIKPNIINNINNNNINNKWWWGHICLIKFLLEIIWLEPVCINLISKEFLLCHIKMIMNLV